MKGAAEAAALSSEPSPQTLRRLQAEALKQREQLAAHDEGQFVRDAGAGVVPAIRARGWTVLAHGEVVIARGAGRLWAVALVGDRPWAVPVGGKPD